MKTLPVKFYDRDTTKVAKELLGKKLFHRVNNKLTAGIIIETEAYLGVIDPACHTYNGRKTERVRSMYKTGGHSYVYLIYGLHYCFNVVTRDEEKPEAVLVRALFPVEGIDIMKRRRNLKDKKSTKNLCSGPGKLCQAMAIDRSCNGLLLTDSQLWIEEQIPFSKLKKYIETSKRIGIDYAGEAVHWPLRFTVPEDAVENLLR